MRQHICETVAPTILHLNIIKHDHAVEMTESGPLSIPRAILRAEVREWLGENIPTAKEMKSLAANIIVEVHFSNHREATAFMLRWW